MRLKDKYDVESLLRNLERVLQIDGSDYEERDMDIVIDNVKKRINRQYQIDLTRNKITDVDLEMSNYRSTVVAYIDNVAITLNSLCGFAMISRFTGIEYVDLSDINYLGYTEDSIRLALKALQVEDDAPRAEDAIESIKIKLGTIDNCREKRFFMVLVVAHAIGFTEVVAAIAELLYQSMD